MVSAKNQLMIDPVYKYVPIFIQIDNLSKQDSPGNRFKSSRAWPPAKEGVISPQIRQLGDSWAIPPLRPSCDGWGSLWSRDHEQRLFLPTWSKLNIFPVSPNSCHCPNMIQAMKSCGSNEKNLGCVATSGFQTNGPKRSARTTNHIFFPNNILTWKMNIIL